MEATCTHRPRSSCALGLASRREDSALEVEDREGEREDEIGGGRSGCDYDTY